MTKQEISKAVQKCLQKGNWMLRRSSNGRSCNADFIWKPIGEWTEAPDWNNQPQCGGGLHGNHFSLKQCYWTNGKDLDFCEVENYIIIDDQKIKTRRARVLLRNELPKIKKWNGSLDLNGCDLKGITLPQTVGGSLYLNECDLKGITLPQTVGRSLDLNECDLKGITLPQTVGGWLDLSGCDLNGITLPQTVGGSLDFRGFKWDNVAKKI